ncbi:MAG: ABC transporter ATP-binding protein [Bacilli bacterium]|nr:ABC transporter ATP-binding protein [Bacilli bacterium]
MDNILKISHVCKTRGKINVLNNVSFAIPKGSIFAFLGSNGAGKSTLIHILLKLMKPNSGEIMLENKLLHHLKNDGQIGVVFQDNTLDEDLSVYDNLMIRGSLYRIEKKRLKNNITHIVNLLSMESFLYKKYGECSGGQKRIAMIARAIIVEPKVLILDEPTTALDPKIRKTVWDVILKLNGEKNMTIFFSSHYLEEAYYAKYVCILNRGKILYEGETEQLLYQNGRKKLILKEKNGFRELYVNSIQEGLQYMNHCNLSKLVSISLGDLSLEEVFLKMMEGG